MAAVLVLVLTAAHGAAADIREPGISNPTPDKVTSIHVAAAPAIDQKTATELVRKKFGGKILSVQLIESDGPPVYRVKNLSPEGVVKIVFVDATNGDVFQ